MDLDFIGDVLYPAFAYPVLFAGLKAPEVRAPRGGWENIAPEEAPKIETATKQASPAPPAPAWEQVVPRGQTIDDILGPEPSGRTIDDILGPEPVQAQGVHTATAGETITPRGQTIDDILGPGPAPQTINDILGPATEKVFKPAPGAVEVPLSDLKPARPADPAKVERAKAHINNALEKPETRREPIAIFTRSDGQKVVLDGKSTLRALKEMGATHASAAQVRYLKGKEASEEVAESAARRDPIKPHGDVPDTPSNRSTTSTGTKTRTTAGDTNEIMATPKQPRGGAYGDVKAEGYHAHHMPARDVSPIPAEEGPAIRMEPEDHRMTASYGNSKDARAYREQQRDLIEQGKFNEAQQMDLDDIRSKFGSKYDKHIQEMQSYTESSDLQKQLQTRGNLK